MDFIDCNTLTQDLNKFLLCIDCRTRSKLSLLASCLHTINAIVLLELSTALLKYFRLYTYTTANQCKI